LILSGHPDLRGLCLALSDWSSELRILEDEEKAARTNPAAHAKPI